MIKLVHVTQNLLYFPSIFHSYFILLRLSTNKQKIDHSGSHNVMLYKCMSILIGTRGAPIHMAHTWYLIRYPNILHPQKVLLVPQARKIPDWSLWLTFHLYEEYVALGSGCAISMQLPGSAEISDGGRLLYSWSMKCSEFLVYISDIPGFTLHLHSLVNTWRNRKQISLYIPDLNWKTRPAVTIQNRKITSRNIWIVSKYYFDR